MEIMKITGRLFTLEFSPGEAVFAVTCGAKTWRARANASVLFADGQRLPFAGRCVRSGPYRTGTLNGFTALYDFGGLTAETVLALEGDDLRCELRVSGARESSLERVFWPAAMEFNLPEGQGYTVLPRMQGALVPSRWPGEIPMLSGGHLYERDGYMPFFGQVDGGAGFCLIWDDAADAGYLPGHVPGGKTEPEPYWRTSLGRLGRRVLRYRFFASGADYVSLAKCYRAYAKSRGRFVSLREKIARNPNAAYLIGCPVIHSGIAVHVSPDSHYYDAAHPEKNDSWATFAQREQELTQLRARGVEKAYLHLDGWGRHGYDNLHPDVFPPHEQAGGADGMRRLSDACRRLGYRFGIHDQYRDYYTDAPTFDADSAICDARGVSPRICYWYGGAQTVLCADLAREYVRRNYDEFERLGIGIDGSYLDVFSIVDLDECFSPAHRMTRSDCIRYRGECFRELTSRGIIVSSEEPAEAMLPYLDLVHHAPLSCMGFEGEALTTAVGVPIPLFSLVYHESVVVPWFGADGKNGGWCIPADTSGFLWALLTGGTAYLNPDDSDETIARVQTAAKLQAKLWDTELCRHEFLDASRRKQRSVFADGTAVTVDFDTGAYQIGRAED